MLRRHLRISASAAALSAALVAAAWAGQVHVKATNSQTFVPAIVTLNRGDQVVWVWTGGSHSVTSGDPITATPDGLFDSGILSYSSTNGTAWSWKSTVTQDRDYYCEPHAPDMAGILEIRTSGASVADFRLTEVVFNAAGGLDLIEITNLGDIDGDLGRYRVVASSGVATVPVNALTVPPNGQVVLHVGASGTNTPTDVYLPALPDLPATGSVALYVPYTKTGPTFADSTNHMVDFVQWQAGGQRSETVAIAAFVGASTTQHFWTAGQFVSGAAAGHSIAFCGLRGEHGAGFWGEIGTPNVGAGLSCATPSVPLSWGRLKTLYR